MSIKFTLILILTITSYQVLASKGKKPDCTKITCGLNCQGSCGWSSLHNRCLYGYTTSVFEYNRGPGCKNKSSEDGSEDDSEDGSEDDSKDGSQDNSEERKTTNTTTTNTDSTTSNTDSTTSNTDSTTTNTDSTTTNTDSTTTNTDSTTTNTDSTTSNIDSTTSKTESTTSNIDSTTSKTESTITNTDSTTSNIDSTISSVNPSTSSSVLEYSLPVLETTIETSFSSDINLETKTLTNTVTSKTISSSKIEETTTSINVKTSNNKIETTPSPDENKTDKIEKSKSASSNNQMNTVIPVTVLLVLIIGVAFILKRNTKKARHSKSPDEVSDTHIEDLTPYPDENDYLEPTLVSEEKDNIKELNLYAEVEDTTMYDMATNESNHLHNDYEYGNSDILGCFDREYQETEFQSPHNGFDYARASATLETVSYQLASDNPNLGDGIYQEPRYDLAG